MSLADRLVDLALEEILKYLNLQDIQNLKEADSKLKIILDERAKKSRFSGSKKLIRERKLQEEGICVNFSVLSVAISPDGQRIASGSDNGTVRQWDVNTGVQIGEPLKGHLDFAWCVAYSPDGTRIVSGSRNGEIRQWNTETGKPWHFSDPLKPIKKPLTGHTDWVSSVAYSPDGKRIVSGSYDMTIRQWNAETGEPWQGPIIGHTRAVNSVACSRDDRQGLRIVSGSCDKTIRQWDAETGEQIGEPLRGHTGWVTSVAWSPILIGRPQGIQDPIGSGKPQGSLGSFHNQRLWNPKGTETGGFGDRQGLRIVSGSVDRTIRQWDAETGEQIGKPLRGHTDWVRSVAYSPNGKRIVSGSEDATIRQWDTVTGKPIGNPLRGHTNWVTSVAYSPNGKHIVSGSSDKTIRIWVV